MPRPLTHSRLWAAIDALAAGDGAALEQLRVDYLGKKFAKYDAAMTKLSFSDAYKEADDGKPPFLRIVLSDKKDPPITLRKLVDESGAWTAATPGSIKNLTAGAAVVPVVALFGGIWIVGVMHRSLEPHSNQW